MQVENRQIGPALPPYVVAEMSCNHNGQFARAIDIIQGAAQAGADAIKFQCYLPDDLARARGGRSKIITDGIWSGLSLGELYDRAHTPRSWFPKMIECANDMGITWFASAFSRHDLRYLEDLKCPAYKVSSFDAQNRVLISLIAQTGKPLIVSLGMADDDAVGQVRHICQRAGRINNLAFLHCVSDYPAARSELNLRQIPALMTKYGLPIGFSDHSNGRDGAVAAVALGACIIEKHITIDADDDGLDSAFSAPIREFSEMVDAVQSIWLSCRGADVKAPYRELCVVT